MAKTRATDVWREIKPFAWNDLAGYLSTAKSTGDTDDYFILLYDQSAQRIRDYSFSADGLAAALAAADSGDVVWIPAGTIGGAGTGTVYIPGDQISSGSYAGSSSTGALISGLTVGQWYAIDGAGGPVTLTLSGAQVYDFDASNDGITFTGQIGKSYSGSYVFMLSAPSFAAHVEAIDSNHGRFYWQATTTGIRVRFNGYSSANSGTLGYVLRSASISSDGVVTIPAGVEIVGLGRNSVLDGAVVCNGKLTGITVTGSISGSGEWLAYNAFGELLTNQQIASSVATGTAPLAVASTTLITNLNADLLDGYHASDLTANGDSVVTDPFQTLTRIVGLVTIVDDGKHNGFPTLVKLATGDLAVFYKQATSHAFDADSVVLMRTSSDGGATWGAAATVATDATYDVQPSAGVVLASGRVVLALNLNSISPDEAIPDSTRIIYSDDDGATWSSPYTIGTSYSDWDHSTGGNIAILPDGRLALGLFGLNTGETYQSAFVVFSADDGETWGGETLLANGEADGRNYQEPNLVQLYDGQLIAMLRSDTGPVADSQIYRAVSTDDGLSWRAPEALFVGTGAPRTIQLSNGMLLIIYRDASDLQADYRISRDNGATWEAAVSLSTGAGVQMAYASAVEYDGGLVGVAWADEDTDTNADLYFTRMFTTLQAGQFVSSVPTGTAPLVVASTTLVENLNADLLDGHEWSEVPANLDDLGDVNAASPSVGDTLYWGGSEWLAGGIRSWGSMYQDDVATVITVSATNTDYIVTGMSQGVLNGMTLDNGRELTIVTPGVYKVDWSISIRCASANQEIEGAVGVNGTREPATSAHVKILTGSDDINMGGTGLLELSGSDLVQIVVRNETSTANITVDHANLSLVYLGPPTDNNALLLENGDYLLLESGDLLLLE